MEESWQVEENLNSSPTNDMAMFPGSLLPALGRDSTEFDFGT